tara:strand:- start:3082 stop:3675 length:594 start_codon:yes stop_codon:yes gene_type:complete
MTKARTLADFTPFDSTGMLTSASTLDPAKLDSSGTIPSTLLAGVGGTNTPSFAITRGSHQAASDNTATRVGFNSVKHDTDSGWVANDNQWVVPTGKAGRYLITTKVTLSSGGIAKLREASVFLKGGSAGTTELDYTTHQHTGNRADAISVSLVGVYTLAAGDKISVEGKVDEFNGTARIDGDGTWGYTNLSITKIIE